MIKAPMPIDIHFGDGTAWHFYDDASVLHISLHVDQSDAAVFPFLVGCAEERGHGEGRGQTVNLPLPSECHGDEAWAIFEQCALPRLRKFSPAFIFLSCGFDGMAGDPTESGCCLTPAFFGAVAAACAECCPGKVVATLQGGYQAEELAAGTTAVMQALAGKRSPPPPVPESETLKAHMARLEAALDDPQRWWDVGKSFDHGCGGSD